MITSQAPDDEGRLIDVAGRSLLIVALVGAGRHIDAAWRSSATRRHVVAPVATALGALRGGERLRLVAVVGVVGMAVHIALLLVDPRGVEPLRLLVPGAVLAGSGLLLALAPRIGRVLERMA
jgi:hypothetical protein